MYTQSTSTYCPDPTDQCGTMKVLIGNQVAFSRSGCIATAECNRSSVAITTGILRTYFYNSTCCETNFCNSGFSIRAPQLAFLGVLLTPTLFAML
ncbi:Hypothetical predicted protein [Pelobates cultripes]|nr:Hypothetical predicted protein [Pelobates cultripes]